METYKSDRILKLENQIAQLELYYLNNKVPTSSQTANN